MCNLDEEPGSVLNQRKSRKVVKCSRFVLYLKVPRLSVFTEFVISKMWEISKSKSRFIHLTPTFPFSYIFSWTQHDIDFFPSKLPTLQLSYGQGAKCLIPGSSCQTFEDRVGWRSVNSLFCCLFWTPAQIPRMKITWVFSQKILERNHPGFLIFRKKSSWKFFLSSPSPYLFQTYPKKNMAFWYPKNPNLCANRRDHVVLKRGINTAKMAPLPPRWIIFGPTPA